MRFRFALALALAAAVPLGGCGINSVPAAEEVVNAAWANVQANYQRRANLIPNLEAAVRASAASERAILTDVINARARATSIQLSAAELDDPARVQAFQQAQAQLGGTLGRLIANTEAYPDLKSQANFTTFLSQYEGTENRILIAVRDYNEAVRAYNTRIRTFPDSVGARVIHGATPKTPFAAQAGAEVAPSVFQNGM